MRITVLNKIVGSFTIFLFLMLATYAVAAVSPTLLKAKQEAESKGYIFFTTHDEIVAMAKKEGKLRVQTSMEPANYKPLINEFKQRYPFITDINLEEFQGTDPMQKFILEMKAGQAKGWDIAFLSIDFAQEYLPYLKKYDILGMAKHGVLKIDPRMIHPVERNLIGVTSVVVVVPYNRKFISEDKVPDKWEDFLKPEFKGKKFVADFRPLQIASLVPAWGLERTLDFARKIGVQQPAWTRGATRINTHISIGEYPLGFDSGLHTVKRFMSKDTTGGMNYKIIEPVPTRNIDHVYGILNVANYPYAALLWFEFLASPEGQKIIDKYDLRASVYTPGSINEQVARGKKLSVVDWDHYNKYQEYAEKIFEAYGFPKAEK